MSQSQDKYPNYDAKHWFLSIIKPKSNKQTHVVQIRKLADWKTGGQNEQVLDDIKK